MPLQSPQRQSPAAVEVALLWHSAGDTHVGNCRSINEDAWLSRTDDRVWVVADGMGGHEAGDRASQTIVRDLAALSLPDNLSDAVDCIEDCLVGVNDALRLAARAEFDGQTMGSTVVIMASDGPVGVALWAGDSRLYRLREGRLEQLTRDHNPVSDLLDSGAVSEAEALAADTNIVTRAVGGHTDLHLDVVVFDVRPDDTFLLCSDGLYRELSGPDLASHMGAADLPAAVGQMVQNVLEGTASDNLSLVLARAVSA